MLPARKDAFLRQHKAGGIRATDIMKSDRLMARRIAHSFLGTSSVETLGNWDGVDHYWPSVNGFEMSVDRSDRFGDAYEVTYQRLGGTHLFVTFDAMSHIGHEGSKPIQYESDLNGELKKGTIRKVGDIPKLFKDLVREYDALEKRIRGDLEKIGGSKWESDFDGFGLQLYHESRDQYSEASMMIAFPGVATVLFGDSDDGEALIHYSKGAGPGGHYGEKEVNKSYKTIEDIKKIVDLAEKLWDQWDSNPF